MIGIELDKGFNKSSFRDLPRPQCIKNLSTTPTAQLQQKYQAPFTQIIAIINNAFYTISA